MLIRSGDQDRCRITFSIARRGSAFGEVGFQGVPRVLRRPATVFNNDACANLFSAVSDDPDGASPETILLVVTVLKPEAGALGAARHDSLILSIAARVV